MQNTARTKEYFNNLYERGKAFADENMTMYYDRRAKEFLNKTLQPNASQAENMQALHAGLRDAKSSMLSLQYEYFKRSVSNAIPQNRMFYYLEATRPGSAFADLDNRRKLAVHHLPTIDELESGNLQRFSNEKKTMTAEELKTVQQIMNGEKLSEIQNPAISDTVLQTAMACDPLDTVQYVKKNQPQLLNEDFAYALGAHTVYGMNKDNIEAFDQRAIRRELPKNCQAKYGVGIYNAEKATKIDSFKKFDVLLTQAKNEAKHEQKVAVEQRLNQLLDDKTTNKAGAKVTLNAVSAPMTTEASRNDIEKLFTQPAPAQCRVQKKEERQKKQSGKKLDIANVVPVQDKSSLKSLIEARRKKNPNDPSIKNLEFFDKVGRYAISDQNKQFIKDETNMMIKKGVKYHNNATSGFYVEKEVSGKTIPEAIDCAGYFQILHNRLAKDIEKKYGKAFSEDFKKEMSGALYSGDIASKFEEKAGFALKGKNEVTLENLKKISPCVMQYSRYNSENKKTSHIVMVMDGKIYESTNGKNRNGVQVNDLAGRLNYLKGLNLLELRAIPIGAVIKKDKAMEIALANGSLKRVDENKQNLQQNQSFFAENNMCPTKEVQEQYMAMR